MPETLIGALKELEEEYARAIDDPAFQASLSVWLSGQVSWERAGDRALQY